MVRTGSFQYLKYGWETAPGTENATRTKIFGKEQKMGALSFKTNVQALREMDTIEVGSFGFMGNEGNATLNWVLSNPWFFRGLFASPVKAGTAPTTYTYDSSVSAAKIISTMSIEAGYDAETQDLVRVLLGVIFSNCTISCKVGDFVRVSAGIQWGKEKAIGTTVASGVAEDSGSSFPFTFVHGALAVDGVTLSQVQSADITFTMNSDLLREINTADATDGYRKGFDITGKFQVSQVDKTYVQKVMDRAEISSTPDLVLTFSNGLAGASMKKIVITCTGLALGEHDNNVEPVEAIFENVSWQIRNVVVVASNQTTTEP